MGTRLQRITTGQRYGMTGKNGVEVPEEEVEEDDVVEPKTDVRDAPAETPAIFAGLIHRSARAVAGLA